MASNISAMDRKVNKPRTTLRTLKNLTEKEKGLLLGLFWFRGASKAALRKSPQDLLTEFGMCLVDPDVSVVLEDKSRAMLEAYLKEQDIKPWF